MGGRAGQVIETCEKAVTDIKLSGLILGILPDDRDGWQSTRPAN